MAVFSKSLSRKGSWGASFDHLVGVVDDHQATIVAVTGNHRAPATANRGDNCHEPQLTLDDGTA
jgi:hypothetical protein